MDENMETNEEELKKHLLPKNVKCDSKRDQSHGRFKGNNNDFIGTARALAQFYPANISSQSVMFGAFYFTTHFAIDTLTSYISLYYKQIGLNASEIGIIAGVQPLVSILYTPLVGYVADKYSIRQYMIVLSLLSMTIANGALYFAPEVRMTNCLYFCQNMSSEDLEDTFHNNETSVSSVDCLTLQTCTLHDLSNSQDLQIVLTFFIIVNLFVQLAGAPWYPLANGCLLASLGSANRNQYGYYRGISGIGSSLGVLVCGLVLGTTAYTITPCCVSLVKARFYIIFLLQLVLLLSLPLAWYMHHGMDVEKLKSERTFKLSTFARALCNLRYSSVIIVITWLAVTCGKMRTFDFWYINVLGGSYTMMGWAGFISKSMLAIVCFCLPSLNQRFGHIPLLVLACIAMGIACLSASVMDNVMWMVVPLIIRETTNAVYAQAQGAFLGNAVEDEYQATLQAVMGSLTFGVGGGLGSILGGGLIESFSPQISYYTFAAISFTMALFLTVTHVLLNIYEKSNEKCELL